MCSTFLSSSLSRMRRVTQEGGPHLSSESSSTTARSCGQRQYLCSCQCETMLLVTASSVHPPFPITSHYFSGDI